MDIDAILEQLTPEEKVALLAGADTWSVAAVERLGIPRLVMSDGPAGVRGESFMDGRSISFPSPSAMAATWDPELIRQVGRALGAEARSKGVHVLLGPTVNLHRHPLGGRHFECFSEDPLLTSEIAVAYVEGVQSTGVACCIKHFVLNDSEFERFTISSEADEATLRELYLAPFEAAVEGGVWAVMSAYNRVEGTFCGEHPRLLTGVLRDEWGFDGAVISDWFGTHSTVEALQAGLDIEMPGPAQHRGQKLIDAVEAGDVTADALDRAARRVLRLIERTAGAVTAAGDSNKRAAANLARQVAGKAAVLLKNTGVLPIDPARTRRLALIVPAGEIGVFQGGGSAQVNPEMVAPIGPALRQALGDQVEVRVERGCVSEQWRLPVGAPLATTPDGAPGVRLDYLRLDDPDGDPVQTGTARELQITALGHRLAGLRLDELLIRAGAILRSTDSGLHRLSISATGTVTVRVDGAPVAAVAADDEEIFGSRRTTQRMDVAMDAGRPYHLEVEFAPTLTRGITSLEATYLPPAEIDYRARAVEAAVWADTVVVMATSPKGWETEGRDRDTMTLPGDQDGMIAAVLAANPHTVVAVNAGSPVSMPWAQDAGAVVLVWLPGQEIGHAVADVLTGAVNPSGRLPTTWTHSAAEAAAHPFYPGADGRVVYGERSDFGYRSPRRDGVAFPFGHGLSYSTFDWGQPQLRSDAGGYTLSVPITHRSGPAGREIVQVYVSTERPDGPPLRLQGFAAIDLDPGQSGAASVDIPAGRLREWTDQGWRRPAGALTAWIGRSAGDLLYQIDLEVLP